MGVEARRRVEKMIVTAVVRDAIRAGYDLQVYTDGEDLTERTKDAGVIVDMLMDLDDAYLKMRKPATAEEYHDHWVRFVFGNDGWDVISDYLTSLDREPAILARANKIAAFYEPD